MDRANLSHRPAKGKSRGIALVLAWALLALSWPVAASAAPETPADADFIPNDALIPPDADLVLADALSPSTAPAGTPGYYQTSDYLIGHVAVGLILPESDGRHEAQSEDWTDQEVAQVQAEVRDALDWWASLEPAAHLTFTVESHLGVATGYEPITHGLGEERLWIGETMAALGFANSSYFAAVRDYVNDLRDRSGSDWALAIFVADSSADADGRFADNLFAYAYLGGPFTVLTYDDSSYTIHNMDAVLAHELGHVFRALDQYAAAGARCDYAAGYLGVKNGNSLAGGACESNVSSIMRGGISSYRTRSIDHFARGQVGWWDSDGDGVLDPVDAEPRLSTRLRAVSGQDANLFIYSGQAWQEPVPSPALADVTISRIAAVEGLVDGQVPVPALPRDGSFDTLSEEFDLMVGLLAPGLHTVEVQALNSMGLISTAWVTETFVYDPVDGALNCSLVSGPVQDAQTGALEFQGVATSAYDDPSPDAPTLAGVQYSLDGGPWLAAVAADGQFDSARESFGLTLADLPDGEHSLALRAVDSNGQVEANVHARQFEVVTSFTVFLPCVQR